MAVKENRHLVLDCETATLPFANEIANNDADKKKKIAIARPLIYDIGWVITNRKGAIIDSKQFLIAETFCVPAVFNTAYYAEKRPIYLNMLSRGETVIKPWREVMEIFVQDAATVKSIGAFNSMFDFKKAIPFTELSINKLYSPDYYQWENVQRALCTRIANEKYKKDEEKEFNSEVFKFRGVSYPLFDIWGLAVEHLLNTVSYKKNCLEHHLLTNSGLYFKTSAESTYQHLCNKYDFIESHTALDDAIIETFILSKIAARHAITEGIKYFPFRDLGYTSDFVTRKKVPDREEVQIVYDALNAYVSSVIEQTEKITNYAQSIINKMTELEKYL